jgi:hypothetical protein
MSESYRGFYDLTEDIIKRLKDAGCSVVTFGDTPDYIRSQKNVVTPGAHISPVGFSTNDINTVQLEVFVYDLTTLIKLDIEQSANPIYGENNTVDNLDTCMGIIDRFMRQIQKRTVQLDTGGYYRVQSSPQWSSVYETGNVRLSGWIGTINFSLQNYTSACE